MATKPLPVHGADVSHHQGTLDLAAAKRAGLQWLYHKATEGDTYTDPECDARRRAAKAAGLPFGVYHFARPEPGDAKAEAGRLAAVHKRLACELRPALDLETTEGMSLAALKTWAKTFSDEVVRLTGVLPVIYSPWGFGLPNLAWVPRYNNDNRKPATPYDVFQFSNGQLGVPNSFTGLGHVDLNTHRDGITLADLLAKGPIKPPAPAAKAERLRFQHASLQFSDGPKAQARDIQKIFTTGFEILTGTEAGRENPNYGFVRDAAKQHGFRLVNLHSNWIAVDRDIIVKGTWEAGEVFVADNEESAGKGHDTTVVWATFVHKTLGRITVLAVHYPTQGRTPKDPNFKINERAARAIGDLAREHGKGNALVFLAGDFNMPFNKGPDPLFGEPLTSAWNELARFENTGHGNIDAIASYDKDGRVSARWTRALDDTEFALATDHFLVQAVFDVKPLKA